MKFEIKRMLKEKKELRMFCGLLLGSLAAKKKKSTTETHAMIIITVWGRPFLFFFVIWPFSFQRTTFHNFDNFIKFICSLKGKKKKRNFFLLLQTNEKKEEQTLLEVEIRVYTFVSLKEKKNFVQHRNWVFPYNEKCIKLSLPFSSEHQLDKRMFAYKSMKMCSLCGRVSPVLVVTHGKHTNARIDKRSKRYLIS